MTGNPRCHWCAQFVSPKTERTRWRSHDADRRWNDHEALLCPVCHEAAHRVAPFWGPLP